MADASLRKAEMELLPSLTHCSADHEEEESTIVSSLLGVTNGGRNVATSDVMLMQRNTATSVVEKVL
jgi:hypothetical protein